METLEKIAIWLTLFYMCALDIQTDFCKLNELLQ